MGLNEIKKPECVHKFSYRDCTIPDDTPECYDECEYYEPKGAIKKTKKTINCDVDQMNEKNSNDPWYDLWNFFHNEHELILLDGQLIDIVDEVRKYIKATDDKPS